MSGMQPSLMTQDAWEVRGARLERYMMDTIPQARHMQIGVGAFDAAGLTLTAPLAPNINHEQTAFGGSMTSLATLSCWGFVWLLLEDTSKLHIVVSDAHMRYLKPITSMLEARCLAPDHLILKRFLDTLARRGRARLELRAEMRQDQELCADYTGNFVAYRQ